MKNLQRVDEYVTHLKNKNTQTGWYFNLPNSDLKKVFILKHQITFIYFFCKIKVRITKKYEVEDQVVSEYYLNLLPQLPRMYDLIVKL